MVALTDEVTAKSGMDSKAGDNDYDFAVFVTNKAFYDKITKELGCSKIYVQKHLRAFCDANIIFDLGNVGIYGTLYADGYYTEYGTSHIKQAFLIQSKEYKEALRNFKPDGI